MRQLQKRGRPDVAFWRDVVEIEGKDRFSPKIIEGLEKSFLFLPILSENYMQRPWCRDEIERFASRAAHERDIDARVIPVFKRPVENHRLPEILNGREGYEFFRRDDLDESKVIEFFEAGRELDETAYQKKLGELAHTIANALPPMRLASETPNPAQSDTRLTVFIAPPADDVLIAHKKLTEELKQAGVRVLPEDPDALLQLDDARQQASEAMSQASFVIHLLGADAGRRVSAFAGRQADKLLEISAEVPTQRLLWAPKTLFEDPLNPDSSILRKERNPNEVLKEYGDFRNDDSLSGAPLGAFVTDVLRRCKTVGSRYPRVLEPGAEIEHIYVMADQPDHALVYSAARILKEVYGKKAYACAFEGADDQRREHHEKHLRTADAVLFCWGETSNVWISNFCEELADLTVIGRERPFAQTALLPCAPSNPLKTDFFNPDISLPLPIADQVSDDALKPFVEALDGAVQ